MLLKAPYVAETQQKNEKSKTLLQVEFGDTQRIEVEENVAVM